MERLLIAVIDKKAIVFLHDFLIVSDRFKKQFKFFKLLLLWE